MRPVRYAFAALLLAFALGACDSDGGFSETNLDGAYTITGLTFDPQPSALSNVNVLGRLDPASTSMTFSGSSRSYVLAFRFAGETAQYLVSGRYTTSGATGVVVTFSGTDRRRLLLPSEATFRYDEAAGTLTFQGTLTNVNLAEYDPGQYGGLNAVDGTLVFTLKRR